MGNYIITIARGYGSGGSHIGKKLSEKLQIPYYDTEILQMASDLSGISESLFFEANERINKGQLAIKNSKGIYSGIIYSTASPKYLADENLFNIQAEVIKTLAIEGKKSCIIMGKSANKIIGSLKNVVTVNIQAPLEKCIENVTERLQINSVDAKEKILRTDKYRRDYYKYYTGGKWDNPKEYDLTINTGAVGEDYATKMIIDLLEKRKFL